MNIIRILSVVLLIAMAAPSVQADDYQTPSYVNMVKSLIRFGAFDINNDHLIDEFAMLSECKLHVNYYKDDFKWNQIRTALRQKIRQEVATYPVAYKYDTKLQFDRYDFKDKLYRFSDKSAVKNANAFVVYSSEGAECGGNKVQFIPPTYRMVLDQSVVIPGIPLVENDAKALLKRMTDNNNIDHLVYVRFNMQITFIAPLHKQDEAHSDKVVWTQGGRTSTESIVRMDSHLNAVDFYEDEAMTKLLYEYKP